MGGSGWVLGGYRGDTGGHSESNMQMTWAAVQGKLHLQPSPGHPPNLPDFARKAELTSQNWCALPLCSSLSHSQRYIHLPYTLGVFKYFALQPKLHTRQTNYNLQMCLFLETSGNSHQERSLCYVLPTPCGVCKCV